MHRRTKSPIQLAGHECPIPITSSLSWVCDGRRPAQCIFDTHTTARLLSGAVRVKAATSHTWRSCLPTMGPVCRSLLLHISALTEPSDAPTKRIQCYTTVNPLASTAILLTGLYWAASVTPWHSLRSLVSPTCRGYLHLERSSATRMVAMCEKKRQEKQDIPTTTRTLPIRCLPSSSTERLPIQHGLSRTLSTFQLSAASCSPLSSSGSSGYVLSCFVWRKWCKRPRTGR